MDTAVRWKRLEVVVNARGVESVGEMLCIADCTPCARLIGGGGGGVVDGAGGGGGGGGGGGSSGVSQLAPAPLDLSSRSCASQQPTEGEGTPSILDRSFQCSEDMGVRFATLLASNPERSPRREEVMALMKQLVDKGQLDELASARLGALEAAME